MNPFDPRAARLLVAYQMPDTLFALCLDETRRKLYGAGMDGYLHVVNLGDGQPAVLKRWPLHDNYVSGLLLREGQIVSCGYDRKLVWTDLETGRRIRSLAAHEGWVRKLASTTDGTLVTIGDDMRVNVWSETGQRVHSLAGHAPRTPEGYLSALYALAVSPDGCYAATGDRAGFVRVWDLARGITTAEFRVPDLYTFDAPKRARAIGGIRGLAFSADGLRLAVSGIGAVTNVDGFVGPCRMELWDWRAALRIAAGQDRHQAILNHVHFGPSGSWLIGAGGGDGGGALVFWNGTDTSPPVVAKPRGHLQAFTCNARGDRLYAAGHQGFQIWQMPS